MWGTARPEGTSIVHKSLSMAGGDGWVLSIASAEALRVGSPSPPKSSMRSPAAAPRSIAALWKQRRGMTMLVATLDQRKVGGVPSSCR